MKTKDKINIAREFRKLPTKSEKLLWKLLRNRAFCDLKFRRQHVIEGYVIDFYCAELNLAVEVDGEIHRDNTEQDFFRQSVIEKQGVIFFRATSENVENNSESVLHNLRSFIKSKKL